MNKIVSSLVCFLLLPAIMIGCGGREETASGGRKQVSESRILRLYHQLKVGVTREQVEAILGKPLFPSLRQPSGEEELWYIREGERLMQPYESPWGPGGIVVTYRDGKLIEKKYNFQWVKHEHIIAYEEKQKAEPRDSADKK